jgi:hypothetical protein
MLDLLLLRQQIGGLDLLYDSQKKRFKSTELIEICVELDNRWKESKFLKLSNKFYHLYRKTKRRYSRYVIQRKFKENQR